MAIILESAGFSVETATNGKAAIEAVTQRHFDAILLDNMLPWGDGARGGWNEDYSVDPLRTVKRILEKMQESGRNIPVWIISALPDEEILAEERTFPFVQEVIKKDCSLTEIAERIRSYLLNAK